MEVDPLLVLELCESATRLSRKFIKLAVLCGATDNDAEDAAKDLKQAIEKVRAQIEVGS